VLSFVFSCCDFPSKIFGAISLEAHPLLDPVSKVIPLPFLPDALDFGLGYRDSFEIDKVHATLRFGRDWIFLSNRQLGL
jgi:hypothetical protein